MDLTERLAGTDAGRALDDAYAAADAAVDSALLGLLRGRIAILLRHDSALAAMSDERQDALTSGARDGFTDLERAALEFVEQYVVDVTNVSDDQIARLRPHLNDSEISNLVNAVLVIEQRLTLELALDAAVSAQ